MGEGEKFIVLGGRPLKGEVEICGAKNSGFKLMIAALYSDSFSTIRNFSKIGDVLSTAEIIKDLGGRVEFDQNHVLRVSGKGLAKQRFSQSSGKLSRASTYFIGPLLKHFGKAILPNPGGCKIGRRPLDRHLEGIRALGAKVNTLNGFFEITTKQLKGGPFTFPKSTHGGTDIMVIAAATAKGKTVLENAAQEPEIDDLIAFLNKMGAKIKRTKSRTIVIEGVNQLKPAEHEVMPDRNEVVTFACAALATKGEVFIKKANPRVLKTFLEALKTINARFGVEKDGIGFFYKGRLRSLNIVTRPHPGFMTDWMGIWTLLMTQAEGESIVHETIFENRFAFVDQLKKMGAKIKLFNPRIVKPESIYNFNLEDDRPEYFHAARIFGPVNLKPARLEITDVRAGATLTIASLVAKGRSELKGVALLDRGYENLDQRLCKLGAAIKRVKDEKK